MKQHRTTEVVIDGATFVVEPDPAMLGPRGAAYGWRVRVGNTVIFDAFDRVACVAFVTGYELGFTNGKRIAG